jgi:dTDP-4-dehydrorhamnose reductase
VILVFGGGGQLASELAAMAAARGVPLTAARRESCDITVPAKVTRILGEVRPALAVNAAGYIEVDKAESEPERAMAVNGDAPGILAAACGAIGIPLIHISTDHVFDGAKGAPYEVDDPVMPLNAYGRSKVAGEAAVRTVLPQHLILRTSWLFGVYGSNFVKTMLRLAEERDAIDVVADHIGAPTPTRDLAEAILVAAEAIRRGAAPWGTYHVAGGTPASRYDQALRIMAARAKAGARRQPTLRPVKAADYPVAAPRPAYAFLDSSKFARAFGFGPADWEAGVDSVVPALLAGRRP